MILVKIRDTTTRFTKAYILDLSILALPRGTLNQKILIAKTQKEYRMTNETEHGSGLQDY